VWGGISRFDRTAPGGAADDTGGRKEKKRTLSALGEVTGRRGVLESQARSSCKGGGSKKEGEGA